MSPEPIEEVHERPCTPGPCAPAPGPGVRVLAQPLNLVPGTRCPVCRNPAERAEVQLRQRWERAGWWQRLDAALRWQRWVLGTEVGRWVDTERAAVLGPCGCEWTESDNPLTDLVVLVHPCGASFELEPRRVVQGPHVQVRAAPQHMRCGCSTEVECEG